MSQFWVPWFTYWVRTPPPLAMSRSLRPWTSESLFVNTSLDCNLVYVQTRSRLHLPGRGDAGVAEEGGPLVQCSLPPEQLDMQQPVCREKLLGGYLKNKSLFQIFIDNKSLFVFYRSIESPCLFKSSLNWLQLTRRTPRQELTRDSGWCGKIRVATGEEASLDISRQPPIPHLSRIKS